MVIKIILKQFLYNSAIVPLDNLLRGHEYVWYDSQ
jgi:hypothetical protein